MQSDNTDDRELEGMVPDPSRLADHVAPDPVDAGPADGAIDDAAGAGEEGNAPPVLPEKPGKGPAKRVKMAEHWGDDQDEVAPDVGLQAVRLGPSATVVVPFTQEMELVQIHYCEEPEIGGYVRCNRDGEDDGGDGCVLCQAGQGLEEKGLLPVYVPATRSIAVLPIGSSSRPGALLPQVMPVVRAGRRVALRVRKPDRMTFKVETRELKEGMDDGAAVIKAFLRRWEAGEVELTSVYPRLDNRDLAALPRIATLLQFEGIDPDDRD